MEIGGIKMKIIRDKTEYNIETKDCIDEITKKTEKGILKEIWISREKETLMYLDVEKSCLGVITNILSLYGIKVQKA